MFYVNNMLAGSGGKIGAPQCQVCHYSSLCFNLLISRGCSTFRDIPKKMYMLQYMTISICLLYVPPFPFTFHLYQPTGSSILITPAYILKNAGLKQEEDPSTYQSVILGHTNACSGQVGYVYPCTTKIVQRFQAVQVVIPARRVPLKFPHLQEMLATF